jgi:hypothetical protein
MELEIETDEYKGVGPITGVYDHEVVLSINGSETTVFCCLECGFTAGDTKLFLEQECGRERNSINETMAEWLERNDFGQASE